VGGNSVNDTLARLENAMDEAAFLKQLAEILQVSGETITADRVLTESEWDSVAVMSTIALIDEYTGRTVSGSALARCGTVREILTVAISG